MAPKNEVVTEQERRRLPQKKWPLLVRSLSDSAKYLNRNAARAAYSAHVPSEPRSVLETKALTLSLSDSRLFSGGGTSVTSTRCNLSNGSRDPKKHHSSLLDIWSDKDPELCSCGCDQDLAEDDDDEEEEDYSDEDEGCFVITSVPQSNEPEEVTNKVTWQ